MPFKSAKQRAYLHINKPKLAAKWSKEYGDRPLSSLDKLLGKKKKRG